MKVSLGKTFANHVLRRRTYELESCSSYQHQSPLTRNHPSRVVSVPTGGERIMGRANPQSRMVGQPAWYARLHGTERRTKGRGEVGLATFCC
jgi:hypothetical protein